MTKKTKQGLLASLIGFIILVASMTLLARHNEWGPFSKKDAVVMEPVNTEVSPESPTEEERTKSEQMRAIQQFLENGGVGVRVDPD